MEHEFLVPQWIERLREDCAAEAARDEAWPVRLLRHEARLLVWHLSNKMGVNRLGIPGLACRTLELYISLQIRRNPSWPMERNVRTAIMKHLCSRFERHLVACVLLVAKMVCANAGQQALVGGHLMLTDLPSRRDLLALEFEIYSALDFRLPLWTGTEAGALLASSAGFPQDLLSATTDMVDMAEILHERLDHHMRCLAFCGDRTNRFRRAMRGSLRSLHVAAGGVAAAAQFLCPERADHILARLAYLVRVPPSFLRCLSQLITQYLDSSSIDNSWLNEQRQCCVRRRERSNEEANAATANKRPRLDPI